MTDPRHEEHLAVLEKARSGDVVFGREWWAALDYVLKELPLMAAKLRKHDARLALNFGAPTFSPTREQWQELNEATEDLRALEAK